MMRKCRLDVWALGVAMTAAGASAQDTAFTVAGDGRVIVAQAGGDAAPAPFPGVDFQPFRPPTEKAPYAGLSTTPADDALLKQLRLPQGIGLTVTFVDTNGPSCGKIEMHDLLQKLDDQILVDQQQFATLIRMRKPGDSIRLSLYRSGLATNATVVLTEKDLPKLASRSWGGRWFGSPETKDWAASLLSNVTYQSSPGGGTTIRFGGTNAPGSSRRFQLRRSSSSRSPGGSASVFAGGDGSASLSSMSITSTDDGSGKMTGSFVTTQGDLTFRMEVLDGRKSLNVTDADGLDVFKGLVDTEVQRKAVPERFQGGLSAVMKMVENYENKLNAKPGPAIPAAAQ